MNRIPLSLTNGVSLDVSRIDAGPRGIRNLTVIFSRAAHYLEPQLSEWKQNTTGRAASEEGALSMIRLNGVGSSWSWAVARALQDQATKLELPENLREYTDPMANVIIAAVLKAAEKLGLRRTESKKFLAACKRLACPDPKSLGVCDRIACEARAYYKLMNASPEFGPFWLERLAPPKAKVSQVSIAKKRGDNIMPPAHNSSGPKTERLSRRKQSPH